MSPPPTPSPEKLAEMNVEWIEPYDAATAPEGLTYAVYETKVRGEGKQGSYWYVLPEGYDADSTARYPVLLWLHGGMSRASQGASAAQLYSTAQQAKKMPGSIVVLVQALPVGWYINSIDRTYPIEDVVIQDLIPHLDNRFRTNGKRGIEGFSMGGYGALHLGIKYNHLFRGISAIAPAILPSLDYEPNERVWDTFRGDQGYYELNHPTTLVKENHEVLRGSGVRVRLLSGGDDHRLAKAIELLSGLMNDAGVEHNRADIAGAGHEYPLILNGLGDEAATFWAAAFA